MIVDSANQNAQQFQCFKIILVYGSAVNNEDNSVQMGQNLRNESFSAVFYLESIKVALEFLYNEFISVSLSILLTAKPLQNNNILQNSYILKCLEVW